MTTGVKYLVRKGHLGDVLLTEPIARVLKRAGHRVVLVTEVEHAAEILPTYDEVRPYSFYLDILASPAHYDFIVLAYELHPEAHYIDGFAICAGVELDMGRIPHVRSGLSALIAGDYCLIAPDTSPWARGMREWPATRYEQLGGEVERLGGLKVVFLRPEHTFREMLALIEHCRIFVGNDSGPCILAQAYGRPSLIIFGGTDHTKVLFSPCAEAVYVDVGCNGCRQRNRNSVVGCNAPVCLDSITVQQVLGRVMDAISAPGVA